MAKSVVGLMFTRYYWILAWGTALGAGGALAFYGYAAEYRPEYTAVVPFQVFSPMPPLGSTAEPGKLSPEEIQQIIHHQEFIFQQEKFLTDVLKSAEFHPDGKESRWLSEHKSNVLQSLKRDLRVVPTSNDASFEIQMTARNPVEAYEIVQAASKVYLSRLHADSINRHSAILRTMEEAVKQAWDRYTLMSDAIVDYQKRKGIDVLKSRFEIEKASLITLNSDFVREDLAAISAEQKYEAVKAAKENAKEVELSADLQLSVENDPTLKELRSTRLNLEQERAAQSVVVRTTDPRLNEIDARLRRVDEQIAETREKLLAEARKRMEKMLLDAAVENRFRADYLGKIRKVREDTVTGIGQDLLVWQQKLDDLKEQGDFVSLLRRQFNLADVNRSTYDTGVSQMDEAIIPVEPSWPQWWTFIPAGAAAGLLLSMIASYRAGASYRRKLNAPPTPPELPSEPVPVTPA